MDRRFEPGEPVLVYLGILDGWKQACRNFWRELCNIYVKL